MNELSRHIEILLLDNDCVIVPGFGGFMAHHRPAEFVEETGLFYPPQRTLGFNPQLTLNDSLLAQSYVEAYDISYPEAVQRIENEVSEIKQAITIYGEYEFHGIGTVKLGTSGVYDFEPCAAGLLTPYLYALNSFSIDIINSISTDKANKQDTAVAGKEAIVDSYEESIPDEQYIEIRLHTLRNLLAAAMVLLLFIFSSIPAGTGSNKVITCSLLDTKVITSFIKTNPLLSESNVSFSEKQISVTDSITDVTTKAIESNDSTKVTEQEDNRFFIVLASKVSKNGAERLTKQLLDAGYKEARIYENGSMRKVIYGNYETETSANHALRGLRISCDIFAEGWISHK